MSDDPTPSPIPEPDGLMGTPETNPPANELTPGLPQATDWSGGTGWEMERPGDVPRTPRPSPEAFEGAREDGAAWPAGEVDYLHSGHLTASRSDQEHKQPGARHPRVDPWRHRRAEPRMFAFLWTVYLLAAVLGSLMWVARSSVLSSSAYGPAARTMLLVIMMGATILWPMVRLSQLRPAGRLIPAGLADVIVVAFPVQLIVWPLIVLAGWPVDAVAVLALMSLVWTILAGGGVVLTQGIARRVEARSGEASTVGAAISVVGMLALLALLLIGPLRVLLTHGGVLGGSGSGAGGGTTEIGVGLDWAWSPFTHIFRLTGTGLKGPSAPVSTMDIAVLALVAAAGGAIWLAAWALDRDKVPPDQKKQSLVIE